MSTLGITAERIVSVFSCLRGPSSLVSLSFILLAPLKGLLTFVSYSFIILYNSSIPLRTNYDRPWYHLQLTHIFCS